MAGKIKLLDATLRDGGQGLEYSFSHGLGRAAFSPQFIQQVIQLQIESNIDIIELGAIWPSGQDKTPFAIYQTLEELSQTLPACPNPCQMYVGLYVDPDTPLQRIPEWNPFMCEGVRVILRYSELQKSLDFCRALAEKGYKVFVQPMLTMRYSDAELDQVIQTANEIKVYALYFVDSFGYMESTDVQRLFEYYDTRLNGGIRIGFHAHNNMNQAYALSKFFLETETDRELIIDACATGMGQGAGNLQTELIVPYLNQKHGNIYKYDAVLDICEMLDERFTQENPWGYSVTRLLPALHKAAYKYALLLRENYHFSYREINEILREMPPAMRHRCTMQNVEQLVEHFKQR